MSNEALLVRYAKFAYQTQRTGLEPMRETLTKDQLLDRVLFAVAQGGYQAIVTSHRHPFELSIFKREEPGSFKTRVYIWNCTHGGRTRSDDEYRVQITGAVPQVSRGERSALLGWHERHQAFVAFDIHRHAGQDSSSPSIQVKESVLIYARRKGFSAYERANGEIAVAFRPEFLVEYFRRASQIHGQKRKLGRFIAALNQIQTISDREIDTVVASGERREVLVEIRKKVREQNFRARVLSAYSNTCAMCGLQLRLIEAAHILPVAIQGSTDETRNGIALCSLHHEAFDRNIVSFTEQFRIEISRDWTREIRKVQLSGGLAQFRDALSSRIILPESRRDWPDPEYIRRSREARGWQS